MHSKSFYSGAARHLDEPLISLLLQSTLLTEEMVFSLNAQCKGDQELFEKILVNEGYMSEHELAQAKAQAHGWEYMDMHRVLIDDDDLRLLPKEFAQANLVVPIKQGKVITFVLKNPGNGPLVRMLKKQFGPDCNITYGTESSIFAALEQYETGFEERAAELFRKFEEAAEKGGSADTSVVDFVDLLLQHGVSKNASDLHIEPTRHDTVVRNRIDGVLRPTIHYPKEAHELVVSRIKVLSNLATDEHAAPQDGKFQYIGSGGKQVDVRVSILKTTNGEKVVLRLLIAEDQALFLDSVGLLSNDQELLQKEMARSWGMVLVTGPTGSGKTTTLYAVLRQINADDVNIATIEDPVEYDLPGTNQVQVNEKVDLNFATGLRSIVRQDPDVVLVGEIRDQETAGISVNAAMTGHLVLSTLHTNTAATTIPRLMDMGVEPFLIASTANVIIAQRLLRKICMKCRVSKDVEAEELASTLPISILEKLSHGRGKVRVYGGKGCEVCGQTGFAGRTGIFELLRVDDAIRQLIMKRADADAIEKAAREAGMNTMLDNGIEKVLQGITTIEEVLRVVRS